MNFEQMAFRADGILENVHLLMVLRSKKYCLNSQMSDKWDVEKWLLLLVLILIPCTLTIEGNCVLSLIIILAWFFRESGIILLYFYLYISTDIVMNEIFPLSQYQKLD